MTDQHGKRLIELDFPLEQASLDLGPREGECAAWAYFDITAHLARAATACRLTRQL